MDKKEKKSAGGKKGKINQKTFMGGTIGLSPKPIRGQYYNLITSLDLHQPCASPSTSPSANISSCPVVKCSPFYCYPPPSCPNQPRRRGC